MSAGGAPLVPTSRYAWLVGIAAIRVTRTSRSTLVIDADRPDLRALDPREALRRRHSGPPARARR